MFPEPRKRTREASQPRNSFRWTARHQGDGRGCHGRRLRRVCPARSLHRRGGVAGPAGGDGPQRRGRQQQVCDDRGRLCREVRDAGRLLPRGGAQAGAAEPEAARGHAQGALLPAQRRHPLPRPQLRPLHHAAMGVAVDGGRRRPGEPLPGPAGAARDAGGQVPRRGWRQLLPDHRPPFGGGSRLGGGGLAAVGPGFSAVDGCRRACGACSGGESAPREAAGGAGQRCCGNAGQRRGAAERLRGGRACRCAGWVSGDGRDVADPFGRLFGGLGRTPPAGCRTGGRSGGGAGAHGGGDGAGVGLLQVHVGRAVARGAGADAAGGSEAVCARAGQRPGAGFRGGGVVRGPGEESAVPCAVDRSDSAGVVRRFR
mmetsp:Transcript_13285/g.28383  ORF Transcript_13285/g.28383 Transcript_13285/m.28383 type:complete len:371 (-) Transcript_13285:3971-5083(-)